MSQQGPDSNQNKPISSPGDGLRSIRSTNLFKAVNFELYVKPNIVVMSIGLTCFGFCLGYLAYMKSKYEGMGYYATVNEEGKEELYEKKKSRWD